MWNATDNECIQRRFIKIIYNAYFTNVPELSQAERKGLLRRLAEISGFDIPRENLEMIASYLTGYPSQVYYAIEIIKNNGYSFLSRNLKMLTDYSAQEVSSLLDKYKNSDKVFSLLALLSQYDNISKSMLYDILEVTPGYIDLYEELYQESFFEIKGVNGEYVRLNEVVRNYISRTDAKILTAHRKRLHELFDHMFKDDDSSWYNSNDFLLGIRENLKQGKQIPNEYVIPSVYLKSMSDLYANMHYDNVLQLGQRALENTQNTDAKIIYEIRYLLCSALAKQKDADCLNQVRHLDYDDRTVLTAFYYRQIGKNDRALERLNELLAKRPEMSKAKREKVLVLKNLQQYDEATDLAKENYYLYPDNPYHIQAYFDCLINNYSKELDNELLGDLVNKLSKIQSEKAQSMYGRCNSLYLAYVEQDERAAFDKIDETIMEFPRDRKYALVVKFDIAQLFHRLDIMEDVINELKSEKSNANTVVLCTSKLIVAQNKIDDAIRYFLKNISFFTDESKTAFCIKLKSYHA